jgi:predicted negative regulator of RcsB-dependent stress response
MTPELWQRLKPLFHAAMDKEPGERADFVKEVCNSDLELERELRLLVQAEEQGNGTFDKPMANLNALFNSEPTRFQPGEMVLGRFRIVRLLGKGGMGEVYEAEDLQLGRIALKTILPEVAISNRAFDRFRREVQLARKVSGLQVCRIHELFLLPAEGRYAKTAFLTMEFLDGITLSQLLDRDGALPSNRALPIALDLCEGLRLIHQEGIIHRDFKSGNVMLCRRNGKVRAVLMDFGLAFDATLDVHTPDAVTRSAPADRTLPGSIAGTPAYMAPEQFEARPVSPATDIYALGVVLYELVTGLHPYAADTPVGAAIRRAKAPAPPSSIQPNIPRHWDRVIEQCLRYEPKQRFQSAEQVAKALKASPINLNNLRRDNPWLMRLAAFFLLACTACAVYAIVLSIGRHRPSAEVQRSYAAGIEALREGSYLKASHAFENATRQDDRFVMAHARLAETWFDLDFDGSGQREMLIATSEERNVPPLDRMYLAAIRATFLQDFPGALTLYRKILDRLPAVEKPAGYVDLGMAYERAGDPKNALTSYERAATLDGGNPASQMHLAVLNSRLHNIPEAEAGFSRAEKLFRDEVNLEGLAELDYQRGYLANEREATEEANSYLNRALGEAQQLPSVQLEIRVLTQLSSVAYSSDHDSQAIELAQRAIRLARDNQLDAWAADGYVRLASAQLDQGHLKEADDSLGESFQIIRQSRQNRVEALANITMASLRDQQHRFDEVLVPAHAALDYYRTNGYFEEAARASLLITRTQRNKGHLKEALQSGNELLVLATRSGNRGRLIQAEELEGTIFLAMESYPDALVHFTNALSLSGSGSLRSYQAVHCADVLSRIGRYSESEKMLKLVPQADIVAGDIRADSLLSQQKYPQAFAFASSIISNPKMDPDMKQKLELDRAISEAHLGKPKLALAHLQSVTAGAGHSGDPTDDADLELRVAGVYLAVGDLQAAREAASKAESYFNTQDLMDSDLRSTLLEASVSSQASDPDSYHALSTKAVDILSKLQQTWDPQVYATYVSRPDIQPLVRDLAAQKPFK